jgi:hypothetical protein
VKDEQLGIGRSGGKAWGKRASRKAVLEGRVVWAGSAVEEVGASCTRGSGGRDTNRRGLTKKRWWA